MNKPFFLGHWVAILFLLLMGCDDGVIDTVPSSFLQTEVNPDDIYLYANPDNYGVRLDPLVNDSIKVNVDVSYSSPNFGTITFIENEGWFYKPNAGFTGVDKVTYTVCHEDECLSALITLYVEDPPDLSNCEFQINGESVETKKNNPVAIRIFANDIVCPYQGSGLSSPEKGSFKAYSYSGSFKNTVYVYFPPKGFVGTDRFSYKLYTNEGFLEAKCTITVTE